MGTINHSVYIIIKIWQYEKQFNYLRKWQYIMKTKL